MPIALGWLTDRYGERCMFRALMAYTPLPLIALAIWHDSPTAFLVFGFLLSRASSGQRSWLPS